MCHIKSKHKIGKQLIELLCRSHPTAHHLSTWAKYEKSLDTRNQIAGLLICIFGLLRLMMFSEEVFTEGYVVLTYALICHRLFWIPLFALSLKWPKLCRAYHFYEVIALVIDGVLAFNGAESQITSNYILLYLLLINTLTFAALYYNFWLSLLALVI